MLAHRFEDALEARARFVRDGVGLLERVAEDHGARLVDDHGSRRARPGREGGQELVELLAHRGDARPWQGQPCGARDLVEALGETRETLLQGVGIFGWVVEAHHQTKAILRDVPDDVVIVGVVAPDLQLRVDPVQLGRQEVQEPEHLVHGGTLHDQPSARSSRNS